MSQAVQRIAALSPEKRALLARRHPLSFAQRRLWFLQQLAPADTSYNVPAVLRLRGRLDVRKLRLSLDETVARHAILRTTFPDFDGKPLPTIAPAEPCPLPVIDLAGLPAACRELEGMRIVAGAVGRPFDLAAGPLVRILLIRFSASEQILLFELHHIVCDGWSREVLLRDVARLYGERAAGRPSSLPEPRIQYADFARWQQEWLQSDACRQQLAYWRQRLQGSPPLLDLPFDRPRSAAGRQPAGGASRRLPVELGERLARCGREENASAFMICLAAFFALLSRASGERDLPVGTPILNRGMLEIEGVVGPFINLLVLRAELPAGATFRELLAQVRRLTLEAHHHQDLPFEMLVDELRPERHSGVHPLFQVLFTLVVSPPAGAALDGLTVAPLAVGTGSAKYDLSLFVTQGERTLSVAAEWNAALFDATTLQRMLGHLERLLAAALADPAAPCDDLPLLGEMESAQVLEGWSDTAVALPPDLCVHDLVGSRAARAPDAPAVLFAGRALTYRQLDERAERLARQLAFLGIGREDLVGLCLERSLAMAVALLGVLKAGAAYLPLDPAFPAERLAFMLGDAGAALVLADAAAPPEGIGAARVFRLDADGGLAEPAPGERPTVAAAPENRAYVLYTSGSTGRPKGVEVTHRAAVNFLLSMHRRPGLTARDTLLAVTTLSFDIHVLEIFLPLLAGARVVICDRLTASDGGALRSALAAAGATVLQATPVTWKLLLDAGWTGGSGFQVLCGGEALSQDLADALGASGAAVWNLFGPTETAVWSSVARLGPGLPVTLGRPIDNTRCFLLDARLAPVPIGYPGELYIGGAGVARGYLGRPALTAERFIPDPFGGGPGDRLYRTGDRARWLADGRLDFLGRTDQQVKVRGFRIELAEIEAALREHPAVRETAVAVRHDADDATADRRRLVAYVVRSSDRVTPEPQLIPRLRQHLQSRLPAYMVPAAFVLLDRLPLTPNGKLDRRALPAPPAVSSAEGAAPPRSLTEELTAGIWSEVLRVAAVGIHDNFFDLGGHSLLAAQVVSRLRDAFGVEVPLRQLFDAPTVASVAAFVEAALRERTGPQLPPLVPVPRDAELPLSFAQERIWSLHRLNPEDTTYNLVKAVRLVGPLQPAALAGALAEVVRRHEILRTSFAPGRGGRPVQVIAPSGAVDLPVVDLSAVGERRQAEVRQQARAEGRRPFDLATGPPLRVRLLRLDQDEHVLLLAVHHIAVDLWSLGVLLREVVVLYQAATAGRPSPLPELPLQYADFAVWQRGWLAGEEVAQKLAYWRQKLAGYLQVVTFSSEGPRSRVPGARGARHAFQLPAGLSGELAALGRRQGATLYMTLLAAYEVLLYVYSGQRDLVIGSPSAGRRFTETEGLVGFFLDTMPLRADLSGNPELRELLARTRQSALEAYAHQEVPLQLIVEALPARRAPLVQVWFAFQNVPFQKVDPAELRFSLLDVEMGSAPFELALLMQDGGDGLTGVFEYRRDVLTSSSVARMAAGFRVLLETAVARPQARLEELAELVRDSDGRHRRALEKDYAAAVGMRLQTVQKRAVRRHVVKMRT